ncbi:adenylate/guanylate cyclase domain-containing protein [Acidimangrovimonas sediminis]|uniref:adenylate/guanylate cyclase domain-containing protein n=1 Tax=Acidimangrovimonas sediminis TaxID=2056283 RepID=UPI000C7FD8D7|nr:adenylate/guanylate cyclase domain-containing protein [Acidimangrovimonas sediminis]
MAENANIRRLAAILAADVVGYSTMMGRDEAGTLAALRQHRVEVFDPAVATHRGRVFKLMGDGALVEFPSVVDAVSCAIEIQSRIHALGTPGGVTLRIGINLGDIIVEGDDVFGDGVNVAARLEPLAEAGGICVASIVNESVGHRVGIAFRDGGEARVKNIVQPIRIWKWHPEDGSAPRVSASPSTHHATARPAPAPDASGGTEAQHLPPVLAGRPSIAVLPLGALGLPRERALMADAVSHDLIQALSRLRWLAITARGSAFRIRESMPDPCDIGARLQVRYVLSGMLDLSGNQLSATLELAETTEGAVIWADRLTVSADAVEELRARIVGHVVESLDIYVPLNEAMQARLGGSDRLDAWATYHLGLHHMYRFTPEDNAKANALFERAIELDPRFARAHGGLSFTRFQDSFMRYVPDPAEAARDARRHAERGLELDPLDPFVNLNMGRSFWLGDAPESAASWLERATRLNPNYAQGFYARAFTANLVGDEPTVSQGVEAAMRLSPLDPLLYGMIAAKALILAQTGREEEAADWAERAANAPGAHFIIWLIAVACLGMAGRTAEAARWAEKVRARRPDANQQHFFSALPMRDPLSRAHFGTALAAQGF